MAIPLFRSKKREPISLDLSMKVNGDVVPLKVREHARTNRLTLRILHGNGGLKLTVPPRTSEREIYAFLDRHEGWVAARMKRLPRQVTIQEGSTILLRGAQHRIVPTGRARGIVSALEKDGEYLLLVPGESESTMSRRVLDFMKKQARIDLEAAVFRYCNALDVRPTSIKLRDTKTRWGSCSTTGTLSFSWRIVQAPPEILEYLAAHEVSHLREMNHSDRFWSLCEQICPHTKRSRAWLKSNGAGLHALDI